jgi:hypothetical protein
MKLLIPIHESCFFNFIFLCFLIFNSNARAESPITTVETGAEPLHVVYSKPKVPVKISVQFKVEGKVLSAHFEILNPHVNAKRYLKRDEYPYQFDVVELFVSTNGKPENLPYYEFEVSPYNQTFIVKVIDPKTTFVDHFKVNGFQSSVSQIKGGWRHF